MVHIQYLGAISQNLTFLCFPRIIFFTPCLNVICEEILQLLECNPSTAFP
jgi:hypothetical protein